MGINSKGKVSKVIINGLLLIGVLIFFVLLVPFTIGLFKGGFLIPEVLSKFNFYTSLGFFLIGIGVFIALELIFRKGDDKYGNGMGFASPGEYPSLKVFKRFTILQLTIISLMIFMIIALLILFSPVRQTSYTGIKGLEVQQFTVIDNIIYESALVPIAENLSLAFSIVFMLFILRSLARKFNWSSAFFRVLCFLIIPIISGLLGIIWHSTVYAGSDVSIITTFFFWMIGGFVTILIGSFVIYWMMHFMNNLLFAITKYISSDFNRIFIGITFIAIVILYFVVYRKRLLGDKDRAKEDKVKID